jgi:hypothetical protein
VTLTSEGAGEFTLAMTNVSSEGTIVTSNDDSLAVPVAPAVLAVSGDAGALYTENAAATREGFEALAEAGDPSTLANTIAALTDLASPLAPGVYAVHESGMPIFSAGEAAMGNGLEALAEDGDPSGLATSLSGHDMVRISGVFNTPSGAMDPGPLTPDAMYSFEIEAVPGERLSLATMLVQSNDLFFAFGETGIALFDGAGDPLNGDQTGSVMLWDAGTEANEWPGAGPHQPLRQAGPDTGPDDTNSSVRQVSDGYHYAPTAQMIKVTVEAVN